MTDGKARPARPVKASVPFSPSFVKTEPDAAVTLVQFSSPQCAPCRATHRILAAAADLHSGISHLEIDVAERLDLARQYGIGRTPTTLVLDSNGHEKYRFTGPPRPEELTRVISDLVAPGGAALTEFRTS
ncbi:MAG: thioredoxin family protein [Bifidobacteriaceae bacterium]|nr:thioredoxin family protein [Bifidobacteriaceae bacterium]